MDSVRSKLMVPKRTVSISALVPAVLPGLTVKFQNLVSIIHVMGGRQEKKMKVSSGTAKVITKTVSEDTADFILFQEVRVHL